MNKYNLIVVLDSKEAVIQEWINRFTVTASDNQYVAHQIFYRIWLFTLRFAPIRSDCSMLKRALAVNLWCVSLFERVRTGRSTLNTYSRPPDKSQGRPLKIKLTQKKDHEEKVHDCCCWQRNMMASINSDVLARWRGGYLAVMEILHA